MKEYTIYELVSMSPEEVEKAGYPEMAAAMRTGVYDDSGFPSMSGYGIHAISSAAIGNESMTPEQYQAWAHDQWLAGRYCIGCQAVGVQTSALGYCATCTAAYDAEWEAVQARKPEQKKE